MALVNTVMKLGVAQNFWKFLISCKSGNGRMTTKLIIGKYLEGRGHVLMEILSQEISL
jgi:hypothetical protein